MTESTPQSTEAEGPERYPVLPLRDIVVFPGSVDMNKLNPIDKFAMKALKAKSSDYRDWDAIATWAKCIATTLKKAA